MAHGNHETEIKLRVKSAASARGMLRRAGFAVCRRRVFEVNTVFDTPERALRTASSLLRIRQAGKLATATFKGVPVSGKHKSREELELEIGDGATLAVIFERLGYLPAFRYEKYRTEYRRGRGEGIAMLDETPVGVFLELEGGPEWIDREAARLGFAESDYLTASYGRLYLEWCAARGIEPAHMTF